MDTASPATFLKPAPAPAPAPAAAAPKTAFDPATIALSVEAMRQFRSGLAQALLYTPGTVQYARVCESTLGAMSRLLEAIGAFKFSITRSELLINGDRVETPGSLRPFLEYIERTMNAANTAGLKLDPGLSGEEIGAFLQLLARRKLPNLESAKVNQFLREQGIERVQVDELRYVALKGEEKVVSGDVAVLSSHAMAQKALTELVDATLDSIEKVGDAEARGQLRAELADQLIEKSEAMLTNLLSTATMRLKAGAAAEQIAVAAVPQRDGAMLREALDLGRLLSEEARNGEAGQRLRELIARVVSPYQARAEDILAQAPLQREHFELLPEWLVNAHAALQEGEAAERVEGILRQSPGALLDEQMFAQIVDVLDELSVARMDAEAERLCAHIAGALRSHTKQERMKAVERLAFLLERSMEQVSSAVQLVEDALIDACTHETCDEVMNLLVAHLSKRCMHHYQLGNFARSKAYLEGIVYLEESSRVALKDEGANIARQAREDLAKTPFAQGLCGDIDQEGEQGETAIRMIQALGVTVWHGLIDRLRHEKDPARARELAADLPKIGPEAVELHFTLLGRELDGATAIRMLDAAPACGDAEALWAAAQGLLRHSDSTARARALELIIKRDDQQAVDALAAALLTETEAERRKAWVQGLSKLTCASAQEALAAELETAVSAPQLEEGLLLPLLEVLSAAGNRSVIGGVAKLLSRPAPAAKPMLVAAIRALAPFFQDPAAVEILERLRKDKDPEIARLALVCQRGIVAAEQQQDAAAVAAAMAAVAAETAPQAVPGKTTRATRRGFEALEASAKVEQLFKAGAGVGSGAAPVETRPAPAPQPAPKAEPSLAGLKPVLEGKLQDLGLATTVRMVGGRDGVLKVDGPGGEAHVYIKGRKVLGISYAGRNDLEALALLETVKDARFAYLAGYFSMPESSMALAIEQIDPALREYRRSRG